MEIEFLNDKWLTFKNKEVLINRFQVSTFEYDGYILKIYTGTKLITEVFDEKNYLKFKNFVLYGCTI